MNMHSRYGVALRRGGAQRLQPAAESVATRERRRRPFQESIGSALSILLREIAPDQNDFARKRRFGCFGIGFDATQHIGDCIGRQAFQGCRRRKQERRSVAGSTGNFRKPRGKRRQACAIRGGVVRIDPSLNAVFARHELGVGNGQRFIASGVAPGVENGCDKRLGDRGRGSTCEDDAVAILGKRREHSIVVAGFDRWKASCGVAEDDVESDRLRSALEQPIEQLGVVGAEKYPRSGCKGFGGEAFLIDGDDHDVRGRRRRS